MTRLAWLVGFCASLGGAASCGHSVAAKKAAAVSAPVDAASYYPLERGWGWAYDVQREGRSVLATYTVAAREGSVALIHAGDERISYTLVPDGILRRQGLSGDDYLLKTPITEGSFWQVAGGTARVVAVGRAVSVPAGRFETCAIVEESRSEPLRTVRTTYAAGVGPIAIEVQHQDTSGGFVTVMKATLRGVTRPGQDPLAAAQP